MVDRVTLRTAVETAWSIFCATHHGVGAGDSRCLLEGHLQGRCEARGEGGGRARKLRPRLSLAVFRRRMLRPLARLTERTAPRSVRPEWTLLPVSYLISGAVVWAMRAVFAEAG
jgi:hypothetical protein